MKIKTLVAVLLLSGGVTSTFAQTENCNSNSSISHEAVRAGNFKDAYAPCMAVLKDCPTLRYYTFTDAQKILVGFLSQIKDRNSADYKKYFDELMDVYDLRMKYIPEFIGKGMKGVPSVADALGAKAVDYLQFAPAPDLNTAYNWLKESVHAEKGGSKGAVLHYFLDTSMQKVKLMIIIPTSFSRIILMLPSMQMTHLLLKPRKLRRLTCKLSRITSWPCSFRVV